MATETIIINEKGKEIIILDVENEIKPMELELLKRKNAEIRRTKPRSIGDNIF